MHIYDISLTISHELPTWPGDRRIELKRVEKIEKGANANVSRVSMSVHTGTHVDAPFHFIPGGQSVEHLPLDILTGRAYLLFLPEVDLITAADLRKSGVPNDTRRLLIKTRNSGYWAKKIPAFQTDFVSLNVDAAQYLVERGVKLVGIDYLSIAPYKNSRPVHELLLNAGIVVVEGLDLSEVSAGWYTLYCLPLPLQGSDGAPARAILIGED